MVIVLLKVLILVGCVYLHWGYRTILPNHRLHSIHQHQNHHHHHNVNKKKNARLAHLMKSPPIVDTTRESARKNFPGNLVVETKFVKGLQEGMEYRRLPKSDLVVSQVCLGTMTFGEQVDEEKSLQILNTAFDEYKINFLVSHQQKQEHHQLNFNLI